MKQRFINQTQVDPKDYERLKRRPEFVRSTLRDPKNIRDIVPIPERTPEQRELTGEAGLAEQGSIEQLKQQVLEPDLGIGIAAIRALV